ncbi:MAG: hypothetical protein PWQ41_1685 [Bacillota bacterium]|jgi:uncharacterized YigZ family protein|nr:hypothetical protein [Bacillota bacterium]
MDTYRTVGREAEVEIKIERSLFIGRVRPVESEEQAKVFIAEVSQKHRQATHNAWAYRVDPERDIRFASDAGEPSGTAGEPILRAILSRGLTQTAVVVTRYFGGKKLGVRGLIDAYGGTAGAALDAAGQVEKVITRQLTVTVAYPHLDRCLYWLNRLGGTVIASSYSEAAHLVLALPRSQVEAFKAEVNDYAEIAGGD